jgi:hypothetical protein
LRFHFFAAGQERFFSLGAGFYRGVDGCVLVYDVTNPKSFENLTNWRKELLHKIGGPKLDKLPPFVVIGAATIHIFVRSLFLALMKIDANGDGAAQETKSTWQSSASCRRQWR